MDKPRKDKGIKRPHRRISLATRLAQKSMYTGDCIVFTGYINTDGYGVIGLGGKQNGVSPTIVAHRAAYLVYYGILPQNKEIDHLCRNRACINPVHLQAVTHTENIQRTFTFYKPDIICKNGHVRTQENTYTARGWAECKICGKEAYHRYLNKTSTYTNR